MSREVRLSRGLVYVDDDQTQRMIIPPFYVDCAGGAKPQKIDIYKVEKTGTATIAQGGSSQNQSLYKLYRKRYEIQNRRLTLRSQSSKKTDWTISQLSTLTFERLSDPSDGTGIWQDISDSTGAKANLSAQAAQVDLLPKNLQADKFEVLRYLDYPVDNACGQRKTLDELTIQPFIQLELTVQNTQFSAATHDNKRTQTTLRTMIVPRDFVSRYEVVQQGVEGVTN
jgi:hypothetical protein